MRARADGQGSGGWCVRQAAQKKTYEKDVKKSKHAQLKTRSCKKMTKGGGGG